MRRALATFLIAVFGFPLIAAVLLVNTDSDLPGCCRRNGQHHCAMSNMASHAEETTARAIQPKCPLLPKAGAAGGSFHGGLPCSRAQVGPLPALRSAKLKANQTVAQIALRGSTHKRGPPSDLD